MKKVKLFLVLILTSSILSFDTTNTIHTTGNESFYYSISPYLIQSQHKHWSNFIYGNLRFKEPQQGKLLTIKNDSIGKVTPLNLSRSIRLILKSITLGIDKLVWASLNHAEMGYRLVTSVNQRKTDKTMVRSWFLDINIQAGNIT